MADRLNNFIALLACKHDSAHSAHWLVHRFEHGLWAVVYVGQSGHTHNNPDDGYKNALEIFVIYN
jgi:hypothetical protein